MGEVYAANTVGAILGALGFSIVLIPWIGTQDAQRLLIALAALAAADRIRARCGIFTMATAVAALVAAMVVVAVLIVDRRAECRGSPSPMDGAC